MAFKRHPYLWFFASWILPSGAAPLKENYLAVPHTVSAPHCPLHVKDHCSFFWEDKGQPSNWRQLNLSFKWSNWVQAGSKPDSFFRGNTTWGCPRVKREEAREGLLKRCIHSNLAIRKLNLLNKHRVLLTYIDVPEFLLQVNVGNREKKKIGKNYWIPQKNIRLFIHRILADNNCYRKYLYYRYIQCLAAHHNHLVTLNHIIHMVPSSTEKCFIHFSETSEIPSSFSSVTCSA